MNLIFNASAGTGKTWQVTELYVALVLGKDHRHLPSGRKPVSPEKILLMTFTDNAAAELRQRVSEKLIMAEAENDLARQVLRKLPAANISTIHAFCAGLLREHALELGLSPGFQTLEDAARETLLNEVLKTEIFQCLERDNEFREFCAGISVLGDHEYSLISTIRSLLEKAASRGLDLTYAETMLPLPERTVTKQSFERIRDELETFDLPKTAADALDALNRLLLDFPSIGKLEAVGKFGRVKKVQHLSDALADLKGRFLTEYFYEQNISTFRSFARCLANCAQSFAEAKRSRDSVDFDDQLLFARDLLKSGPFSEPPFKWIIVDEVQDTSRVQCEVIKALWAPSVNLVICGDKKQSIYAWRSADPGVMPELEKQMAERGEYKPVPLSVSRRSKDRVIDAVNALFEKIYTPYDALGRLEPLAGEAACVEFLGADNEDQGRDEEMTAVARRIRLLVHGGAEWRPRFGYNGTAFAENEPFNFGDILILLKRSTHQAVLEKALRDAGIPYSGGGKGKALFEQQEVRDLLMFLQVLCEPTNDLALVGFLRSPFASLTDDEIVQLGWNGETFDHEILRKQFFESAKAERLLRYRAQTGSKLASQLIREMVRETAFDAQLAGQLGGEQKLANFKKALDWIRAAERGGQVLLPDVMRLFEQYIKTPPRSGAAEALLPDPEQNAVTIMTVHGAKGLTKRVCFVPDISFGDVTEPGFAMFSPEGTLEMNSSVLSGDKVKSPGWDAARKADQTVRDLESTNVFYVAMTRARDLVVLSGAGTKDSKGWKKLAEGFLESASPEILCRRTFAEILEIATSLKLETGNLPPATQHSTPVSFQPLEIPKGFERKPVTSLVEYSTPDTRHSTPAGDRRSFGTLGHAVLEELAKNNWRGDVPETGDDVLDRQLTAAREVLRSETAGAEALFAECPFVLRRGDVILDGTIDLLAQFPSKAWKIFDYKFSNESPETVLKTYSPQLAAYQEAVEKLHPGAEVSASLVLIGETVQIVSA